MKRRTNSSCLRRASQPSRPYHSRSNARSAARTTQDGISQEQRPSMQHWRISTEQIVLTTLQRFRMARAAHTSTSIPRSSRQTYIPLGADRSLRLCIKRVSSSKNVRCTRALSSQRPIPAGSEGSLADTIPMYLTDLPERHRCVSRPHSRTTNAGICRCGKVHLQS